MWAQRPNRGAGVNSARAGPEHSGSGDRGAQDTTLPAVGRAEEKVREGPRDWKPGRSKSFGHGANLLCCAVDLSFLLFLRINARLIVIKE